MMRVMRLAELVVGATIIVVIEVVIGIGQLIHGFGQPALPKDEWEWDDPNYVD